MFFDTYRNQAAARITRVLMAVVLVSGGLSACSTMHSIFGGGHAAKSQDADDETGPKFPEPRSTGLGAPALSSVPTTTPTPPSTKQEQEKVIEGLVADRERAHYSNQESRVEPIDVRPLTQAQAEPDVAPAEPPKAKGAPVEPVTKLATAPESGTSTATADELAARADIPPPPPPPPSDAGRPRLPTGAAAASVGPQVPEAAGGGQQASSGPRAYGALGVRSDGFRSLDAFQSSGGRAIRAASLNFGINSRELSPADRRTLGDVAQMVKKDGGTLRVIGRSNDASEAAQTRATNTARELQRQGIAQDRIFVGTDSGSEGTVEVFLDK
jgi:hypothetical protein